MKLRYLISRFIQQAYQMSSSNPNYQQNRFCFTKYDQERLRLIDIGANLSDDMYKGRYNHQDKQHHPGNLV